MTSTTTKQTVYGQCIEMEKDRFVLERCLSLCLDPLFHAGASNKMHCLLSVIECEPVCTTTAATVP